MSTMKDLKTYTILKMIIVTFLLQELFQVLITLKVNCSFFDTGSIGLFHKGENGRSKLMEAKNFGHLNLRL